MELNFFTQRIFMYSPTYHKLFKGKHPTAGQDENFVNMTASINFKEELDKDDQRVLFIAIENKMWEDPELVDEKIGDREFGLYFEMTEKELLFLKKYIEAFLKK